MPLQECSVIPWRGFRYIEGSCMVEVDVYWFYWMTLTTYTLHTLPPEGLSLGAISGYLGMSRVAFENFGDERARAFPKTAGVIKDILAWINRIMPERDPKSPLPHERHAQVTRDCPKRQTFRW